MSVACVVPCYTSVVVHTIVQPERVVEVVSCEMLAVLPESHVLSFNTSEPVIQCL